MLNTIQRMAELFAKSTIHDNVSKARKSKKPEKEKVEFEGKIINEAMCSKNSLTAKSGFKAEEIFRTDNKIKMALETYFNLTIVSMEKNQGKKYDTLITFDNNTKVNIQNKKIENLGGRGDSFDRRHIKNTFDNPFIKKYFSPSLIVCLNYININNINNNLSKLNSWNIFNLRDN